MSIERTKTTKEWLTILAMSETDFISEMVKDHDDLDLKSPKELEAATKKTLKRLLDERPWAEKEALFGG